MPDDTYPPESIRVLAGMKPRRPGELREDVREGTLRRMRRALAETEAKLDRLRADGRAPGDAQVLEAEAWRDGLIRDIEEMDR